MNGSYMTHARRGEPVEISSPSDGNPTGCLRFGGNVDSLYLFPPADPIDAHLFLETLIERATELHKQVLAIVEERLQVP